MPAAINGKPITDYFSQLVHYLNKNEVGNIQVCYRYPVAAPTESGTGSKSGYLSLVGPGAFATLTRAAMKGHELAIINFNNGAQTCYLSWVKRSFNKAFTLFVQGFSHDTTVVSRCLISSVAQLDHIEFVDSRNLIELTFKTEEGNNCFLEIEYTINQ